MSERRQWHCDIDDSEWAHLRTTGGCVWGAARRLATFLEHASGGLGAFKAGSRVLELGSGAGWLGLTVARNAPGCVVQMTEQAEGGALKWLEHNIQKARACGKELCEVRAGECDWGVAGRPLDGQEDSEATCTLRQHWDVVLGSDLVYEDAGVHLLPKVLASVVKSDTLCFYAHTRGRFEDKDMEFVSNLEEAGLSVREVWEEGAPPPPPSPSSPLTELFPEQRVAVWWVSSGEGARSRVERSGLHVSEAAPAAEWRRSQRH
eukprot:TRINITY_DN26560_c0_g1_i1.p1 TRINITY_DN26560_c0_g1~~TRINITY_DN26560_c0_g1_i1.p1  ORF type:complete len:262 (+),score=66.93 TRINITY_DN26560_c0_g1_i1:124-909(+)